MLRYQPEDDPPRPAPTTQERQHERDDEMSLKYGVEMKRLEYERENSEKNRGLAFFALILLAAFIIGYCLFR